MGERQPSPSRNAHTRPFAPSSCARSISPSRPERGISRLPALRPLTTPPEPSAPAKTLNSVSDERAGEVAELEAETEVRAVGAEPGERVVVADARERQLELRAAHALEHVRDQALVHGQDVLDLDERHLDVELGEIRLAVGALVLVTEATGDLVVALEAADHQELLEELRRLGQRVERAGLAARGHEEVTRALGGRAGEDGRLDLQESLAVEELAHRARDGGSRRDRALERLAAQVEVAVAKPHLLPHLAREALDLERRRVRVRELVRGADAELELAGRPSRG